jgi:Fe-S-cluster-containing dehydrogenase component
MKACPEEAIYKNDQGIVIVDEEKCNTCGDCVVACPYGMIFQNDEGLAYKCDYCNGAPACAPECTPGAILYKEEDKELRRLRGLQMKQRVETGTPEQKRYKLGVSILESARQ